jgi:hypothetical protein
MIRYLNARRARSAHYRSMARRLVLLVAALGTLAMMSAPEALGCSVEREKHCYSLVEWNMNQSLGEDVYGGHAALETYSGYVPRWEDGDFITNEMWVGTGEEGAKWIEGGAVIGNYLNATTPDYFVAREYGSKEYYEFDYPGASPGYNTEYGLYLDEPYGANGDWCATWDWDSKPDFCFSGFSTVSTELEAGMEYATPTSSGAYNNGKSVGQALWTNWTWHEVWAGTYNHAEIHRIKPLCIVAPLFGDTWGSVSFSYEAPGC